MPNIGDVIPADPENPDVLPGDAPAAIVPQNPPGQHGLGIESRMAAAPKVGDTIPGDPDNPEMLPGSNEQTYGTPSQTAIGAIEGVERGFLGPAAPYLQTKISQALGENPDDVKAAIRGRQEQSGGIGVLGEMAGFGASALTGVGEAALVGKIGKGFQAATGIGKGAGIASKIAGGAARGFAEMAAIQGGDEVTKKILNDPNQTASSAALNIGLAGVLGTAMGGAFASVPPLWNATAGPAAEKILNKIKMDWGLGEAVKPDGQTISPILRNVLSIFGGVSKENIDKYVANSHEIMAAPEFNDLYNNILEQLTDVHEALDQKKVNYQNAKSAFSDFLAGQKVELRQKGYDVGAADTMAQEALKQAQTRPAQGLQEQAIDAAPKAFSAVQKLKDQALEMSQGARDILENTPGELSLKPVFAAIRPMQDKLYSQGFPTLAEELGKQMDIFAHQYGDKIAYSDAKSMVQGLQQRGKWSFGANEIANGLSPYFNQLSGIMNSALKEAVPAYEKAMRPTAEAFELLGKLDRYGTPESAVKASLGLKGAANYTNEMPLLRDLENKTGVRFTHQLEHYADPVRREAMQKALPEFQNAQRTAEALQQLKDPETRAAIEKSAYLSSQHQELQRAEKALEFGVERKEALKGLSPATLEGRMRSVMNGRSLHGRAALEGVRGMEDMSVPQILDLIAVREAFEKGAMNGSRNVNLWSHALGGVGGLIGGLSGEGWFGAAGAAGAGAVIGGMVDREGPAIVKTLLDKYLDKYGDLPRVMGASPEATRAGLVHFLGKDVSPDAAAFKSTINYIEAARRGMGALKNASKAIFESGKVLPPHLMPNPEKTEKLNDRAKKIQLNQKHALSIGGGLSTYMPHHGMALANSAMRAVTLINGHRPGSTKGAPLDPEISPPYEQTHAFEEGLKIAQQPLYALQSLKDGTLSHRDMQVLSALHPDYYQHMVKAVSEALHDHLAKEGKIPYTLKQSLSLFLGQNLDSSLHQPNMQAAQSVFALQKMQAQARAQASTQKLSKASGQYRTREQASSTRALKG